MIVFETFELSVGLQLFKLKPDATIFPASKAHDADEIDQLILILVELEA